MRRNRFALLSGILAGFVIVGAQATPAWGPFQSNPSGGGPSAGVEPNESLTVSAQVKVSTDSTVMFLSDSFTLDLPVVVELVGYDAEVRISGDETPLMVCSDLGDDLEELEYIALSTDDGATYPDTLGPGFSDRTITTLGDGGEPSCWPWHVPEQFQDLQCKMIVVARVPEPENREIPHGPGEDELPNDGERKADVSDAATGDLCRAEVLCEPEPDVGGTLPPSDSKGSTGPAVQKGTWSSVKAMYR